MKRTKRTCQRRLRVELLESRCVLAAGVSPAFVPGSLMVEPSDSHSSLRFLASEPHPHDANVRITTNLNAADSTNADQIWIGGNAGYELDGSGFTVGVWDGGLVRTTHQEFGGRVTAIDSSGLSDHATHVTGTIVAAGIEPEARGMAGGATARSRDFFDDTNEMRDDAGLIDASNHSYSFITGWHVLSESQLLGFLGLEVTTSTGFIDTWWDDYTLFGEDRGFGKYSDSTAELDEILVDNPHLLSVWSAGNDRNDQYSNASGDNTFVAYFSQDPGEVGWSEPGWYLADNGGATPAPGPDGNGSTGYDTLSSMQTAKNSLVVGSTLDVTEDPRSANDIELNSFSSSGPTDDGRIKPDVVGNGNSLLSAGAGNDSRYFRASGTSMSAPNVTGSAVLVMQHYEQQLGSRATAAMIKALLTHSATDAGNVGPDFQYGWGLVDVRAAADLISDAAGDATANWLGEQTHTGVAWSRQFTALGDQPLKATIVWTDPAGTPHQSDTLDQPTLALVNDLDLTVIGPNGATHYPWRLNPTAPSEPAARTGRNFVDNVEQVLIDLPTPGVYNLVVHNFSGVAMQDFSLVTSGARATTMAGDFDGNGEYDCDDIDLLVAEIASSLHDPEFDLNQDSFVDASDLDWWLMVAGQSTLGGAEGYSLGDANLDGNVDTLDFAAWNTHRFTSGNGWCGGDFNADGSTDISDFHIWNSHRQSVVVPIVISAPKMLFHESPLPRGQQRNSWDWVIESQKEDERNVNGYEPIMHLPMAQLATSWVVSY